MGVEEKNVKVSQFAKEYNKKWRSRRVMLTLAVLAAIIVVGAVLFTALKPTKTSRSQSLVNKVTELQKKSSCSNGLKQVSPQTSDLESGNGYNNAAREAGLDYLVRCNLVAGHTYTALTYAQELDQLYAQDGNAASAKKAQLDQLITYIKNYGQH